MKHHENTMREGIYIKTTDIDLKTMKFVWLKLAMGAVITLASIILLVFFMLIGSAFGGGGMYIMLILWLALTGGALDVIPGMGSITGILETFIGIALGYVDECCLGCCFLHHQEGALILPRPAP